MMPAKGGGKGGGAQRDEVWAKAGLANFPWKPEHKMWDTWRGNVKMLTDTASEDAIGMFLKTTSPAEIETAFEQVAAAIVDVGGVAD